MYIFVIHFDFPNRLSYTSSLRSQKLKKSHHHKHQTLRLTNQKSTSSNTTAKQKKLHTKTLHHHQNLQTYCHQNQINQLSLKVSHNPMFHWMHFHHKHLSLMHKRQKSLHHKPHKCHCHQLVWKFHNYNQPAYHNCHLKISKMLTHQEIISLPRHNRLLFIVSIVCYYQVVFTMTY